MVALFIVNSKMKERIGFLGKPLSHFITIGRYFKRVTLSQSLSWEKE